MEKLLVTGSNSELAKLFINDFGNKFELSAISTSNKKHSKYIKKLVILDYQDPDFFSIVKECDHILHFAWSKQSFDNHENIKLINFLLKVKNKSTKIYFITSASASSKSLSIYARQKFEASKIIIENNQVNIILGLPISKFSYQNKLLSKSLNLLPFSLRFSKDFINIYSIDLKKFNEELFNIINKQITINNYFLFEEIKTINEYISGIEIKRKRKIIIPAGIFVYFLKLLSIINSCIVRITLKHGKLDKLLTFFSKDDKYLSEVIKNQKKLTLK
jgi:hypothetical protein